MSPEKWVILLYTYGPFAFALLLLVVAEGKLRKSLREQRGSGKPPGLKTVDATLYALNWVVFFILVFISVYAWAHRGGVAIIRGTFTHLKGTENVLASENVYINAQYVGGKRIPGSYDWLLITDAQVADGYKLKFALDQSVPDHEQVSFYELVIHPQFYGKQIDLVYDRQKDNVNVQLDGQKRDVLVPNAALPPNRAQQRIAYAGEPFNAAVFVNKLESYDPIIRRDARVDLAARGREAIPWIQEVLTNPKSSYYLRLGVLVALDNMKDPMAGALNPSAQTAIINATTESDPSLRGEALTYVGKYASAALWAKFEQIFSDAKREQVGEAASPRVQRLARAGLNILYNRGVALTNNYHKPSDRKSIDAAISAFSDAWSLRGLATSGDRIYFPKALYGWGIALHEVSVAERLPNGSRDATRVNAAKDKFKEFLGAIPDVQKYPYPDEIKHARAYLDRPESASLR